MPRRTLWALPAAIGVVGIAGMVAGTGGDAWPLALGWIALGVAVGAFEAWAHSKRARVLLPAIAIVVLPVLTFEGGLFMWPAAVALLAAAAVAPEPAGRGSPA